MENNNRNPYSKRNKHCRQHQQQGQSGNTNRGGGNEGNQDMTSSVARANQTNDTNMNVSLDNGHSIDLSVNESMILTASSGLFGDESGMDEEINNMALPTTPQVATNHQFTPNN
jgi:hypothetical protein